MNKTELIQQTAAQTGLSRKDTETALNAAINLMTNALSQGEKVQLVGFGTFETRERPPHTARNPKTMEQVEVGATRTVSFRPGKALKGSVAL
ncbi:MAG: HU family DNA-binding protein [Clostridiales bacterium]|nr:HU family DNA-binding protein [Clostridiales bacterium]MCD7801679.1 HU family DNA-binding protein [Clostridiales bacterium]MCD7881972.1 HU family DNA-binding protein [Clostridiales bacterium]